MVGAEQNKLINGGNDRVFGLNVTLGFFCIHSKQLTVLTLLRSGKLTWLAEKWGARIELMYFLLKMGILYCYVSEMAYLVP